MNSIGPATPTSADPLPPMAPPYVDENPEIEMILEGLEAAENEIREAVADAYEAGARLNPDSAEALNDIDYNEAEEPSTTPELAALHEEWISDAEEDRLWQRKSLGE